MISLTRILKMNWIAVTFLGLIILFSSVKTNSQSTTLISQEEFEKAFDELLNELSIADFDKALDDVSNPDSYDLEKQFKIIDSNFADENETPSMYWYASLTAYKNKVFAKITGFIKSKYTEFKSSVAKSIANYKGKAFSIARNLTLTLGEKSWEFIKDHTEECVNRTYIELNTIPKKIQSKFQECAGSKIDAVMSKLTEVFNINELSDVKDKVKGDLVDCMKNPTAKECLNNIFGSVFDTVKSKVDATKNQINNLTSIDPKKLMGNLLDEIVGCANLVTDINDTFKKVGNTPMDCFQRFVNKYLPEQNASQN